MKLTKYCVESLLCIIKLRYYLFLFICLFYCLFFVKHKIHSYVCIIISEVQNKKVSRGCESQDIP